MHINRVFPNDFLSQPGTGISQRFDTTISKNGFYEKRNSKIEFPYLEVNVDFSDRSMQSSLELAEFFNQMKGRAYTFNFKNPMNYSTAGGQKPTLTDSFMYEDEFEVLKSDLEFRMFNKITGKPLTLLKEGSILLSIINEDGTPYRIYTDDYSGRLTELENSYPNAQIRDLFHEADPQNKFIQVDYELGILTTTSNLNYSTVNQIKKIYLSGEFYYKVRFNTDNLVINYNGYDFVSADNFQLIEVNN